MKVCVLTHTFPRYDSDVTAAFMKEFCNGLTENGLKVILLTPFDVSFKRHGDRFKIVTYKYIYPSRFHLLGYSRTMKADVALNKLSFLLLPFLILFGTIKLYRVVKSEKIDIINVHWIIPNGVMALIVSKLTGVPYVITLPGTDAYLAYKYKAIGLVAKVIANNSQALYSNSSWLLKRIVDLGVNVQNRGVISYPADVAKFKPLKSGLDKYRVRLGLGKNELVILAVGRLVYKKGFNFLITAMPAISQKFPNAKLLIGGEGDLMDSLKQLTKKLKMEHRVLFLGNIKRDEIIYYYNLAAVFVAPSVVDLQGNVDGGPVVSLESMACGVPQVATSVLGVSDEIKNGLNGYVVKQRDAKGLAEAITKILSSSKLRQQMGQANRKLVISDLSTKKIGAKYAEVFRKVLDQNI